MPSEKTAKTSAEDFLPVDRRLVSLKTAAKRCEGCPLFASATQTVFGEGAKHARVVFVGEQPGDQEDQEGRPFVGPAGRYLRRELSDAGIDEMEIYLTNAVKHFKWTPQGKRRLHAKPSAREINACRPWLEAELAALEPAILVCLGAVAAQAILGKDFRLTKEHGRPVSTAWAPWTLATYHPSALLRAKALPGGEQMLQDFRDDLRTIANELHSIAAKGK
jgi:uracil-DNA glycosylase